MSERKLIAQTPQGTPRRRRHPPEGVLPAEMPPGVRTIKALRNRRRVIE